MVGMGIISVFIGILFFMNPCFRLLDFLPDVIGCILIIAGTSKLAVIDHRIENARRYAVYYAFVSFMKIPLGFYIFTHEQGYLLPATFVFSVLEGMLMVGFFVSLIGGFQYLLSRENCDDKHLKLSENASVVCFIFAIARAVVSFAPEILSLGKQKDSFDYNFTATADMNAAYAKPYAEILAFVIILIFGIYCAFVIGRFLTAMRRDRDFIASLGARYDKYAEDNVETMNLRKVRFALLLFFLAVLLWFNQILDFVNIIPNTFSYVFMILGTVYMIKKLVCEKLRSTLFVYIPLIALSVYNNMVQYSLLSSTDIDFIYDHMIVKKVPVMLQSTGDLWRLMIPIVVEYVLLAALVVSICKAFDSLEFIRDKDTVSIFEILFGIGTAAYFVSCCYVYFGQFIRTANTFVSQKLDVYVKYDSILSLFEWINLISFIIVLYAAYRYGHDVFVRVKAKGEIEE